MKYRKTCFVIFLLLQALSSFAQDVISQKLLTLPEDSGKVNKITTYIEANKTQDPERSRQLAKLVLDISRRLGYNEGMGKAYFYLGYFDFVGGNSRNSIVFYNRAIYFYKKISDKIDEARTLGGIANAYQVMGRYDSVTFFRMAAIALLEKSGDTVAAEGMSILSMQYYNLAVGYENLLDQSEKALFYFKKAEALARGCNNISIVVSALNGQTGILCGLKQIREAMNASREALGLAKSSDDNSLLSNAYHSYARVLFADNKLEPAIYAIRLAISYGDKAGDIHRFAVSSMTYSDILKKKGDESTRVDVLNKLLKKIKGYDCSEYIWYIYRSLAEANYELGKYKRAYDLLNYQTAFRDSTVKIENNRIMADMDFRYQAAQKEKELSAKQLLLTRKDLELQRSRQYVFYSIGAIFVVLVFGVFIYINLRNKKGVHLRQLETIQRENEIQLLHALMHGEETERARIARDLHDGVAGMLAATKLHFRSLALQLQELHSYKEYRQTLELLDETAAEVRKTSHNLMPELLMKCGLDEALRRYCSNVSSSQLLSVQYDGWGVDKRYKESFELLVYRVVQELLNNIMKHSKADIAIVQMTADENNLFISIEDNGIGLQDHNGEKGMGLHTVKERVESMNGTIEFDNSSNDGLNVYLQFDTTAMLKKIPSYESNKFRYN